MEKLAQKIIEKFDNPADLKHRKILFANNKLDIIFFADLTDTTKVYDSIIKPLQETTEQKNNIDYIKDEILYADEVEEIFEEKVCLTNLLKGKVILIFSNHILSIDCELIVARAVSEPPTSAVLKGPREGFVENLKINLSLIRRRLPTEKLKVKNMQIGRYTKTDISVVHIDGIADKKIVKEIIKKIEKIDIDGIIDSSFIANILAVKPKSIFKQIGTTEKPDILVSKILEGRIGIVVDGSPIILTLPFILAEDMQNSEDYYSSAVHSTFIRILRFFAVVVAVVLPGTYVALQTFHYKILPLDFLISILNTTQGIPFTPITESIFIILLFEILYDASLRMPRYLGLALSIVGALILGDTAVQAGLVSPPSVMIIALSGLTFYTIPDQANQLSLLRLIFVWVGGVLGIYGILLTIFFVLAYMCDLDSYGASYLAPMSPFVKNDMKDFLIKKPLYKQKHRPTSINQNQKNKVRINLEKNKN